MTPHQRAREIVNASGGAPPKQYELLITAIAAALNDEIEACLQEVIKVSDRLAYQNLWKERVGANRAIEALQQRKGARHGL